MDLGFDGKTALITGSYRGTGAGVARVLAAEGAHVLVHGFDHGQPDDVVAEIAAAGGSAEAVITDLAGDDAGLGNVASSVDVLVNNYGTPMGSSWSSMAEWADEWDRNVLVGVRVTQACLEGMRSRSWGRVVFVGTVGAHRPGDRNPGYYAAKAGLHNLVRGLAKELRGSGVTANLVSPGMIATAEVQAMLTRSAAKRELSTDWADVERWGAEHAFPNLTARIPEPDDIGRVVAMVASEAAWHVNGAVGLRRKLIESKPRSLHGKCRRPL